MRPTRPRPELQRSHSELPIKVAAAVPKPSFPPCITAFDLSADDIKRNYSVNDLQTWDKAKFPLPPLNTMVGLGRYRTAAAADPEWRAEYVRKQLNGLDGLQSMVAELDMTGINGMTAEEWQVLTGPSSRRGSAISSNSTRTTASSAGTQDPVIDPQSGARIARGFSLTGSSSARSSFNVHSRKGSTLSMMSKPDEGKEVVLGSPLRAQSAAGSEERRVSGNLSTINEVQLNIGLIPDITKKLPRPCEFTDKGDPDSAVASDVEDDDDAAWTDEVESARVSAITQILKEGKKPEPLPGLSKVRTSSSDKKRRKSSNLVDRSKTIRAPPGPPGQRRSSKHYNLHALHKRAKSDEKQTEPAPLMLPTPESADSPGLVMQVKRPAALIVRDRKKHSEELARPVSTNDGTLLAENQLEFSPRAPRKRAPTAVFCRDVAMQAGLAVHNAV